MTGGNPATVPAPMQIWRVGRAGEVGEFRRTEPADGFIAGGNRFDVVGGGVLYCASEPKGCYAETLNRLRPSPAVREAVGLDAPFMNTGTVPRDWRTARRLGRIRLDEHALPFLDADDPRTWRALDSFLAPDLAELNLTEHLDSSHVRGMNRRLTQAIASWAYVQADEEDRPTYSGIRYVSRLGDFECWAVFEGTPYTVEERAIAADDAQLHEIAQLFNLSLM